MDLSSLLTPINETFGDVPPAAGRRARIGAGDAAKPALVAARAAGAPGAVLVVVPRALRARDLVDELTAWLGPEAGRLKLYPERDTLPYERAAEDPWEVSQRLEVLRRLVRAAGRSSSPARRRWRSARCRAKRCAPPSRRSRSGTAATPRSSCAACRPPDSSIEALVEAPGQAARRGGIVDVFPPQASQPVRIEYFGSQVESIRSFDPATQRSEARLESLIIGLAYEFSPDQQEARRLLESLDFRAVSEDAGARMRDALEALATGDLRDAPPFLAALLSPHSLLDHLPDDALLVLDETQDLSRALDEYVAETATMRIEREARGELPIGLPAAQANWADLQQAAGRTVIELSRFAAEETGAMRPPFSAAPGYGGRVRVLARDLAEATRRGEAVVIASQQAARLATILGDEGVGVRQVESRVEAPEPALVQLVKGSVPHGWRLGGEQPLLLLTDAEVFGFVKQRRAAARAGADRAGLLADLSPGDYVVHIEHGIARFAGLSCEPSTAYRARVPGAAVRRGRPPLRARPSRSDRVSRYIGPGEHRPSLTRLGSGSGRGRRTASAAPSQTSRRSCWSSMPPREVAEGHAFAPDTPWQQELEAVLPLRRDARPVRAIAAVKHDMEAPRPMDRLVCGDVGYGKTEVAVRAAFKAVMDGTQVAVLVPTTVLAQQHFNTFRERLAGLPARVEMLSRFRQRRASSARIVADAGGRQRSTSSSARTGCFRRTSSSRTSGS